MGKGLLLWHAEMEPFEPYEGLKRVQSGDPTDRAVVASNGQPIAKMARSTLGQLLVLVLVAGCLQTPVRKQEGPHPECERPVSPEIAARCWGYAMGVDVSFVHCQRLGGLTVDYDCDAREGATVYALRCNTVYGCALRAAGVGDLR